MKKKKKYYYSYKEYYLLVSHKQNLRGTFKIHSCAISTCEFFLAAISDALLQVLQLVFHLLILPLCLLTLPPEQTPGGRQTL